MIDYKQHFKTGIQQQLNAAQHEAVTQKNGSFLIIAGAGSGKTRVITARILHLIMECNVEPSSIIALTFTNKAALEMQNRIAEFMPYLESKPIIATFHSYCLRLLKMNKHLLGQETFSILDAADQAKLIQNLVKEHEMNGTFQPKQLASQFSTFKMNLLLNLDQEIAIPHYHLQKFAQLYNEYEKQKRASNYLDFDDLLYKTYQLFHNNASFQTLHHTRHRHILVDEYQDTNTIQHELLKKMSLGPDKTLPIDSVCAVGDEDQSIYSWRGATVSNILTFDQQFPQTKIIKLEQNYRSTQRILDIANHVITHNHQRKHKKLWSEDNATHTPLQLECLSDVQEAYTFAHAITLLKKEQPLNSIAILYRTHYQSRIIEEALIKESIPYKIIGGIQFYERKEIKDLIAYLRLIVNPFDKMSFSRVINCPLRGLGEKFEELFMTTWNQNPFSSFKDIALMLLEQKQITTRQIQSVQSFLRIFESLTESNMPTHALDTIIKQTAYFQYIADTFDIQEAQTKKENVLEFIRAAQYVEHKQQTTLSSFLEDISLMQEQTVKQNDTDCIHMMTLHSAKGLEFDTVFLSGLEDGILPSNGAIDQGNIEEERRLLYVGITRARKKLLITHCRYRNTFGQITVQKPSRFLDEIPLQYIHRQEAKHWSKHEAIELLKKWIYQRFIDHHAMKQTKETEYQFYKKQETSKEIAPQLTPKPTLSFKRLQSVKHPTFGLGIIQNIEHKGSKSFITVLFTYHGRKTIESSFLELI